MPAVILSFPRRQLPTALHADEISVRAFVFAYLAARGVPSTPAHRNAVRKAVLAVPGGLPAPHGDVEAFVTRTVRFEDRGARSR